MTGLQLVLCDDNKSDLKELLSSAEDYIDLRGLHGKAICFSSPEEVLRYSEQTGTDDIIIYLLDVVMPEFDGIELGRKIRGLNKRSAVIYISNTPEYSLDAFSVRAFSYLIKPFSREKLFLELDECIDGLNVSPQKLSVKTANGIMLLALPEIIAIEYFDHKLIYHLTGGRRLEGVYRKQSFDLQTQELNRTGLFLKISASYLINSQNVQGIQADSFIMCDGSQYKITRKYIGTKGKYMYGEMQQYRI